MIDTKHAFCFRSRSSRRFLSVGLRKYSPDSNCRSTCVPHHTGKHPLFPNYAWRQQTRTFRGSWAGGNGVYIFFCGLMLLMGSRPAAERSAFFVSSRSFLRAVFSDVLRCFRRNLGRKRSQDSFASFGSLANSRLIISSCPTPCSQKPNELA